MCDGFAGMEEERKRLTGFILVIKPNKKESFLSRLIKRK